MRKIVGGLMLCVLGLGCNFGDDPLSPDHTLAARAAGRDLTIAGLDSLLKSVKPSPRPSLFSASTLATIWVDYHLIAAAAANDDTLHAALESAIAPAVNAIKVDRMLERLRTPSTDTATEATYAAAGHGLIALRRIFLAFPPNSTLPQRDSVGTVANELRKRLTVANFESVARQYSTDAVSAANGGVMGVLHSSTVDPNLFRILKRMPQDSITVPFAIPTGIEILQRMSWADARRQFIPAYMRAGRDAETNKIADLALARSDFRVESGAPAKARRAIADRAASVNDTTSLLCVYDRGGQFTTKDLVAWLDVAPPEQTMFLARGIEQVSDAQITAMIEKLAGRSILLRSADSAGIAPSEAEKEAIRAELKAQLAGFWEALRVTPAQIRAAGGSGVSERERTAQARVDDYLRTQMAESGQLSPVPPLLRRALRSRYEGLVSMVALRVWLGLT